MADKINPPTNGGSGSGPVNPAGAAVKKVAKKKTTVAAPPPPAEPVKRNLPTIDELIEEQKKSGTYQDFHKNDPLISGEPDPQMLEVHKFLGIELPHEEENVLNSKNQGVSDTLVNLFQQVLNRPGAPVYYTTAAVPPQPPGITPSPPAEMLVAPNNVQEPTPPETSRINIEPPPISSPPEAELAAAEVADPTPINEPQPSESVEELVSEEAEVILPPGEAIEAVDEVDVVSAEAGEEDVEEHESESEVLSEADSLQEVSETAQIAEEEVVMEDDTLLEEADLADSADDEQSESPDFEPPSVIMGAENSIPEMERAAAEPDPAPVVEEMTPSILSAEEELPGQIEFNLSMIIAPHPDKLSVFTEDNDFTLILSDIKSSEIRKSLQRLLPYKKWGIDEVFFRKSLEHRDFVIISQIPEKSCYDFLRQIDNLALKVHVGQTRTIMRWLKKENIFKNARG